MSFLVYAHILVKETGLKKQNFSDLPLYNETVRDIQYAKLYTLKT